jgi:hypothetical protein
MKFHQFVIVAKRKNLEIWVRDIERIALLNVETNMVLIIEHIGPEKKQPQTMIDKRRKTLEKNHGVVCGFMVNDYAGEYYKGFYCRSSYEKMFLDFADQYGYIVSKAPTIKYEFNGKVKLFS